jgi:hypothetical protein
VHKCRQVLRKRKIRDSFMRLLQSEWVNLIESLCAPGRGN